MSSSIVVTDLDGTITTAETWRGVLAWARANHPSRAASWFLRARIPSVLAARAGLVPKEQFRARWLDDLAGLLAGLPADREAELAESVVDQWLWPARRTRALDRVAAELATAREADAAARLVVATGAYQSIADAWASRMGADVALGTPLETAGGRLTGRLGNAVQTGEQKAMAVRALADGGVIVAAFGDTAADVPFLRLARRSVAVAPDAELRRVAVAEGWEVLEPADP